MVDTGVMTAIDLNADVGERDTPDDGDLPLLDAVTSASLACGFHAGNPAVMRSTAAACVARGVTIGAHVSFRDREGFGRRPVDVEPARLVSDIVEQWWTLSDEVGAAGGTLAYVKPHGALYAAMGADSRTATAVVDALCAVGATALVAQAGTVVAEIAGAAGVTVVPEGFPDRGYRPDGTLAARGDPGALVDDPVEVGRRAVSMVLDHGVEAVDGSWTAVRTRTLCIHGDSPGAAETARAVRAALEACGVVLGSFEPGGPRGAV